MITKQNLHERICDIEPISNNEQTYYEFIRESEKEFGISPARFDVMDDKEFERYLDYLDELWFK